MEVIIITGTPGTGKTTLAVKLAKKLGFHYIDVNKVIRKYGLSESYDRKRKTKVVDVKKLNRALIKNVSTIKKYNSIINSNKKIQFNKKYSIINSNIKKYNKTLKNNENQRFSSLKLKILNNKKISNIKNKTIKIKNGIIIDSHLSHYLPKRYVDLCIVTKCELKQLEKRLKNKKYSKAKIRENLDAEIFDVCLNEAKENKHKIIVVDTAKGINIKKILNKIIIKW